MGAEADYTGDAKGYAWKGADDVGKITADVYDHGYIFR